MIFLKILLKRKRFEKKIVLLFSENVDGSFTMDFYQKLSKKQKMQKFSQSENPLTRQYRQAVARRRQRLITVQLT